MRRARRPLGRSSAASSASGGSTRTDPPGVAADDLDAEHLAVVASIFVRAIGIRAAGGRDVRADADGDVPSDVPATLSIGVPQAIRLFSSAPAGADDRPSFRRDGDRAVTGAVLRALTPLFG